MSSIDPYIYIDSTNNIWKFFENDNKELHYNIMYEEGKWTKESLIDKEVLGFAVYVDEDERIHIVYSNIKGELKYCTLNDNQWVGNKLYQIETDEFEIRNLKVEIIRDEMHIFYLLIGNDGSDHGVLMHCIWNGKEVRNTSLQDIILISNLKELYSINVNKKKTIDIFFITDEGAEISLNHSRYKDYMWSPVKRLYGIQGEDIGFEVLRNKQEIHILNKSKADSIYFLDHVCIDMNGDIKEFRVYESNKELTDPILFIESNKVHCCWLEEGEIFCSTFDNEKWSSVFYFDKGTELTVRRYNCFICCHGESSMKAIEIYVTNELDLSLFIPSQFVVNIKNSLKYESNEDNISLAKEDESLQNLKLELSQVKSDKRKLEKKIASINMELQKKQRFLEEYEERIARILEQKRKADENYKLFLELRQNLQKELEDTNQQLLQERKIKASIENRFNECEKENINIRQQLQIISEEKKKLYEELEFEKNQSIMERLLRKKPSGE